MKGIIKMNDSLKKEFKKPDAPLLGADGNVFNLIAVASRALKDNGYPDMAKEMSSKVMSSNSYEEALGIILDYVEPVDVYSYEANEFSGMDYE